MSGQGPAKPIRGNRLALRPPARTDAPRLARLLDDQAVSTMTRLVPHPYSQEQALTFVEAAQDRAEGSVRLLIETADMGVVGGLGLDMGQSRAPELGFWIGRHFWGKGLATEAVQTALLWAHQDLGLRQIQAAHFDDNHASGWVLCKAGFLYTGVRSQTLSIARGHTVPSRHMIWLA